jgi:polar amino acid transport system ATP-binding protein
MRRQKASVLDRVRPRVGFVFQQFHLWPHLKVIDNLIDGRRELRRRDLSSERSREVQGSPASWRGDNLFRSTKDGDFATFVSSARADVDDPIAVSNHVHIVFDENNSVARFHQSV